MNTKDLLVFSILASAVLAPTAMAQSALEIEEITVTAQKREQSLGDVPVTVTAIGAAELTAAGVQTIEDVQHIVPGLNIYTATTPALASIAIRGAGTGAADPTLEPSVGVFVDGVFMPRSVFGLSDLVDTQQVEVLMGPQGTLYGRNTNSGVISVSSKGMPDAFEGDAELTAGDYGLLEGKLSLGGVNEAGNFGYRLGIMSSQHDGFMTSAVTGDDSIADEERLAIRGQLFWDISDTANARLIAYHSENDSGRGTPESGWNDSSVLYGYLAGLSTATGAPVPGTDPTDYIIDATPNFAAVEVDGASLQIDVDVFGDVTFTSITAFQTWSQSDVVQDTDGIAVPIVFTNTNLDEDTFSQELRLTSPGGETVDWLIGAFYFDSDLERGSPTDVFADYAFGMPGIATPPPLDALVPNLVVAGDYAIWHNTFDAEALALFGQAIWNISDETSLTFGLRYGEEDKSFTTFLNAFDANDVPYTLANVLSGAYTGGLWVPFTSGAFAVGGPSAIPGVAVGGPVNRAGSRSDDAVTGMISFNHFIDDTMLYATIATGTKSGGFNGTFGAATVEQREFDNEDTINYEIGAKFNRLLDGRARVNLSIFRTVYDDFQAATFDPDTVQFLVANAGKQITQGIDFDGMLLVNENLELGARLQYLDATYDSFTGANCHPLSGETFVGSACDLSGQVMEYAPEWTGSFSADYTREIGETGGEFYSRLGFTFKSDHIADPLRAPYARDISYELWDARIGYRNDNWDVSLWGKNLTDETYTNITTAQLFANVFGAADAGASSLNHHAWINDPRMWGITVRYGF